MRTGFLYWLRECFDRAGLHGDDLVAHNAKQAYGKYATFPTDADDDLRKAEALGWIKRGKYSPTISQRAFLGLSYAKEPFPDLHASCWFWVPAQYGDPKRLEAQAWLKSEESRRLGIHRCAKAICHVLVEKPGDICDRTDPHHV